MKNRKELCTTVSRLSSCWVCRTSAPGQEGSRRGAKLWSPQRAPRGKAAPTAAVLKQAWKLPHRAGCCWSGQRCCNPNLCQKAALYPAAPAQGSAPAAPHQDSCARRPCRRWSAAACMWEGERRWEAASGSAPRAAHIHAHPVTNLF